jgi:hypothetical protein
VITVHSGFRGLTVRSPTGEIFQATSAAVLFRQIGRAGIADQTVRLDIGNTAYVEWRDFQSAVRGLSVEPSVVVEPKREPGEHRFQQILVDGYRNAPRPERDRTGNAPRRFR